MIPAAPTDIRIVGNWRIAVPIMLFVAVLLGSFATALERQDDAQEAALQEALSNKDPKQGPVYYDYPPDVRPVHLGRLTYYICEGDTLIYVVPSGSAFDSDDREYIPNSPKCK